MRCVYAVRNSEYSFDKLACALGSLLAGNLYSHVFVMASDSPFFEKREGVVLVHLTIFVLDNTSTKPLDWC